MASSTINVVVLLSLNLLFSTLVTVTNADSCHCSDHPKIPPKHNPPTPTPAKASCPRDTLKLGVCADILKFDLVHLVVGTPPKTPCCSLIQGLADAEAAVCLCTAIKANVLGTNLNVSVSLSLLLNYCGKNVPYGFQCA